MRQVNSLAGMGRPRKERSLSQALAAFSFITIPSLRTPGSRLALYLETAQVARAKAQCSEPGTFMRIIIPQTCLLTGCHGQGEACLKAAIQLIGQTPACLEEKQLAPELAKPQDLLLSFASHLISNLSPNLGRVSVACDYSLDIPTGARSGAPEYFIKVKKRQNYTSSS